MLSVNLEYFIVKHEIQNSINIQFRRNQTFTSDDAFYKICNDDQDNNEYLAIKYIRFSGKDII